MALFFGLDSGGTKTLAAIADERGNVLRVSTADSLDPLAVRDWESRLARMVTELTQALDAPISAAVLGLPFHDEITEVSRAQSAAAADLFDCAPLVQNDVRIAFDGAFAGGGGVLVLAGTGSMAWASRGGIEAEQVRTGGWGDVVGDEGSAFWIGREALARVSQELDGRVAKTGFADRLLGLSGIPSGALMDWLYRQGNPRREIAGIARFVSEIAEAGDEIAIDLLQDAAECLVIAAQAAWRRAAGESVLRWSFAGGVMQSVIVRNRIGERLGSPPVPAQLPPVGGAILRAAQSFGVTTGPHWVGRLSEQLKSKLK